MNQGHNSKAYDAIKLLLDQNSFVELSGSVCARTTDFTINELSEESDGVITGYGLMNGRAVFVFSQDAEVLQGSMGEMHCKKIEELYNMAIKVGAPVVALLNSTGMRIQESADCLTAFGKVINAVNNASGLVPLFTVVTGNCGGGLSLIPSMSDFNYVVKDEGHLFVNAPNTIDNNYTEKCDSSAGEFRGKYTGVVDDCLTLEEIRNAIINILNLVPLNNTEGVTTYECNDDLNREITTTFDTFDPYNLIAEIADNNIFVETKKLYAPDMITGVIPMNGITVGVIANNDKDGRITVDALRKADSFALYCDAYEIPMLFIEDAVGFEATMCAEKHIAKEMAAFVKTLCEADVPKITLIPRRAYGTPYVMMNSKAIGADFVYAYERASIGMMPAEFAGKILFGDDPEAQAKTADFNTTHQSAIAFAKRGAVDRIIAEKDTRKYLLSAYDLLYTKYNAVCDKKHSLR